MPQVTAPSCVALPRGAVLFGENYGEPIPARHGARVQANLAE